MQNVDKNFGPSFSVISKSSPSNLMVFTALALASAFDDVSFLFMWEPTGMQLL